MQLYNEYSSGFQILFSINVKICPLVDSISIHVLNHFTPIISLWFGIPAGLLHRRLDFMFSLTGVYYTK